MGADVASIGARQLEIQYDAEGGDVGQAEISDLQEKQAYASFYPCM